MVVDEAWRLVSDICEIVEARKDMALNRAGGKREVMSLGQYIMGLKGMSIDGVKWDANIT